MTSAVYEISDRFVEQLASLDPGTATQKGIAGHESEMTDFSPSGHDARDHLVRKTLAELNATEATTVADRLAAGVLRESLELSVAEFDAGEQLRAIRIVRGDVDGARRIFDLMPKASAHDWSVIADRMSKVPAAFAGMRESWKLGIERGVVAQRRQVLAVSKQLEGWSGLGAPAFFEILAESAAEVADAPHDALRQAAKACSAAMATTASFLRDVYSPVADSRDGVGPERHAIARRRFMGMNVDAKEAYEWGFGEVERLDREMTRVAQEIKPGASLSEVRQLLDTDPAQSISGEDALRDWLQELMDDAMSFLIAKNHFDIPQKIRRVEAMIAPAGGAAAMYYTPPSEDLTRPGRTWYPANGRNLFPRWREPTTTYHEGVPGHHLQLATATINSEKLSRFQRNTYIWGHGEGWAMYAERLMEELGKYANPEFHLGFLYMQAFRAARVVIDIGIHCGFAIPADWSWHAEEQWTPELGCEFLAVRSPFDDAFNRSEINRYLGMPGQAMSYKLGERVWLDLREAARKKHRSNFDLRKWHAYALDLGNLGLDLLQKELSRF